MTLEALLQDARVLPVLVPGSVTTAVETARALVTGGLRVIEVALRTPSAFDALSAIVAEVPDAIVGVGTVTWPAQFVEARRRGAHFAVSPGATAALCAAAHDSGLEYLPAATTISEVLALREQGYRLQKFFPAALAGGPRALAALASVVPDVRLCPSGGIDETNLLEYLQLDNVLCISGSWMVPASAVAAQEWSMIERLARRAREAACPTGAG